MPFTIIEHHQFCTINIANNRSTESEFWFWNVLLKEDSTIICSTRTYQDLESAINAAHKCQENIDFRYQQKDREIQAVREYVSKCGKSIDIVPYGHEFWIAKYREYPIIKYGIINFSPTTGLTGYPYLWLQKLINDALQDFYLPKEDYDCDFSPYSPIEMGWR